MLDIERIKREESTGSINNISMTEADKNEVEINKQEERITDASRMRNN